MLLLGLTAASNLARYFQGRLRQRHRKAVHIPPDWRWNCSRIVASTIDSEQFWIHWIRTDSVRQLMTMGNLYCVTGNTQTNRNPIVVCLRCRLSLLTNSQTGKLDNRVAMACKAFILSSQLPASLDCLSCAAYFSRFGLSRFDDNLSSSRRKCPEKLVERNVGRGVFDPGNTRLAGFHSCPKFLFETTPSPLADV